MSIPIIIKFYIEHIIILLNLVFDCDLVIIDNYFNNYIFVRRKLYSKYVFEIKIYFFILGKSALNLFSQIFINTFTVNNKVKRFKFK